MKKNSTWNDLLKPVVVLMAICIIVSGVLAATNNLTAPIIEENARRRANAARAEMLPADDYILIESDMAGVSEVYKAVDGTGKELGYVITASGTGYGGAVTYMVAFDSDGKIVNATVLEQAETAGLGSRITEESFYTQFIGLTEERSKDNIDLITGATISSNASLTAVNNARTAFNQYAKGIVVVELTLEEKLGQLFGEDTPARVLTDEFTHEKAVEFWKTDKGVIIVTEGKGNGIIGDEHVSGEYLKTYVAFGEDGTIAGVYYDTSSETQGLGTKIAEEPFISIFNGKTNTDGVDTIAGCTYSSKGAIGAVGKACDVYAELF